MTAPRFVRNRTNRCALALAVVCLLGACGADRNGPASEAFGGLSDGDMRVIREFSADARRAAEQQAALVRSESDEDVQGMRRAVDRMTETVADMNQRSLNADNSDLRATLQDYSRTVARMVGAFDRYVTYYETDGPADPALEAQLGSDIDATATEAERVDQEFLNRTLDAASPEQRDRIRAEYKRLARTYEQP